jgi:OOP family OmpA-OmpF porin
MSRSPLLSSLPLALALAVSMMASTAEAQRVYDLERFTPATNADGFLGIQGTRTPGPFNVNFGLFATYQSNPFVLRRTTDGSVTPVISDRITSDLFVEVGILGRFALVLDASVVAWQQGNAPFYDGGPALSVAAIRDPRLLARARLLGEDSTVDRARHEGEGVAIQFGGTIPVGMEQTFAGEGAPSLEAALLGDFHILDFGLGGQIGWRHRFAEPEILGVSFRNQLYFGFALQVPAFFLENLYAIAEVDVTTDGENPFGNAASTVVEWRFGARYTIGDVQLTLAGGSGLVGGVGSPSFRGILGITFAPRVHDRDNDHIVDGEDACPSLPEDFDQNADEDGCPEPDNDGDLVPDLDDACPNEAADFGSDANDDGCNDPIVDSDGDGMLDDVDACPTEAEDVDGQDDADGCPDLDDDADGVPDTADACPHVAEDADGIDDQDGCPDLDDDHDTVLDPADLCPAAPEDLDQHDDADGCPDPDDDRDGVPDASDTCATTAETLNGVTDEDGCPDRGGRARLRTSGTIGTRDYVITGALRFARDGTLPASEAPVVDELVRRIAADWVAADADRHVIALPTGPEARVEALRAALTARGLAEASFGIVTRTELRVGAIRVERFVPPLHDAAVEDVAPIAPGPTAPPLTMHPIDAAQLRAPITPTPAPSAP